jgi:hypothetical protein
VWFVDECKLLHHIAANQIVAATSINNHMTGMLLNDILGLEQRVSLIFLRLLHLCTKHTLHNETLIVFSVTSINMLFRCSLVTCMVSSKQSKCIFIKVTSRGLHTISFDHQNALARTVTLHVPKALTTMTLDISCSTRGCNRGSTSG